tara:strand:- start:12659 stop:16237 length:3579 start_codon:yes stop_codon:yes gene_type:complete
MEKATLHELLSSKYKRDQWIDILKVVFKSGNVFANPQPADLPLKEKWKNAYQLGSFSTADSYKLAVFEIEVADNIDLDRNRVSLRNLLNKYYKQTDGIFAVFIQKDRWRFSFVSQTEDYDEENEEWIKSETEPKRYTYVLGEGEAVKTATDRFHKLVEETNVSFEDIKEAFSVEKLNKEFYNKVVKFFYQLIGAKESGRSGTQHPHLLQLPSISKSDKQTHQEFAVRLIGRTVFCWFLKYKKSKQGNPIVPKESLSSRNIPNNYYHEFLEKLFFQVMNTPLDERRNDIPEILQEIPFLNGGLFEPHRQDFYALDEGTGLSKNLNTLKIPDAWFKEFYAVLEQYNFTIDENSVEDADVSVDPEMLGRIFENLLAEIDPASGKTARKATGSYYTPREIVDYMVDESISKHLVRETDVSESRIQPLLKFDPEIKHDISGDESVAMIRALNRLKALDPACGSGAFPMGLLQKMVRVLEKIDPDSERWKTLQLENIPNAAIRRIVKKKLDRATVQYARKLGIIQHSIYGVDIQPIAAEISKLRFFLSLVVDENVDETKENWDIEPLPNLEFKFVTANSLISLPREDSVTIDLFGASDLLNRLGTIRDDYLQAYGEEKEILKNQFKETQDAIFKKELKGTGKHKNKRAMMLSSWEPFEDSVTGWFDPKWMFGIDQFHIVIGNPPYGGDKISNELKAEMGLGSKDPYGAFIARFLPEGKQASPLKNEGALCFIVSDTFMTIKTHRELREMMMDNYIHKMIRVHPDTFKATVNTAIIVCERNEFPKQDGKPAPQFDESHRCLMADLTRISIHEQHERFVHLLERTVQYEHPLPEADTEIAEEINGTLRMRGPDWSSESSEEYAFYTYPQSKIKTNSNNPFFVASPKLYNLLNDKDKTGNEHSIELNERKIIVSKLDDISDIKEGITVGDNYTYIFKKVEARGSYNTYDPDLVLTVKEIKSFTDEEKRYGINEDDYGGKFLIPHDKGGASDSDDGWLPNYYVPTEYYLDWRKSSHDIMKDLKGHFFRNAEYHFRPGITFSHTGFYAPTFRYGSSSLFNVESTTIFPYSNSLEYLLSILNSRLTRYLLKNYIDTTVHASTGKVAEIPIQIEEVEQLIKLTKNVVDRQKIDTRYDYASHEQIKIDKLVYDAYGLNEHDIREVENWYARRYPRLVAAQKENLRKLGKSDDYLELYGEVGVKTEM